MQLILRRFQGIRYLANFAIVAVVILVPSCMEASDASNSEESELLMKINAVQQQIMAQGNMTQAEEDALLSLCSIISHEDGSCDTFMRSTSFLGAPML